MTNRSSKAVDDFFSTMLDEKSTADELQQQPLERLLAQVSSVDAEIAISSEVIDPALLQVAQPKEVISVVSEEQPSEPITLVQEEVEVKVEVQAKPKSLQEELDNHFPVLYFKVAEYTFAVPLIKLKAIYRLKEPTKLFGKPDWFCGIQVEREQNLGVVDTARYLMPEKFNSPLEHSPNYKYIIVLGDSNWGLKCDVLVDSDNLSHEQIKWRAGGTSTPWLAGTVKERMCGLLAVDTLVELFEQKTSV